MKLSLLTALNFFKRKNRFRITAKLAEKAATNPHQSEECLPIGSVEYLPVHMNLDQVNRKDFLSHVHKNSDGLMQARQAAHKGQSRWHTNKFTQEYRTDSLELNPQIEIYYRKLGLAQQRPTAVIGDPQPLELSWDS